MRIISNDFHQNIPGKELPIAGGLPRFARDFSSFLTSQGHEWVGLIYESGETPGYVSCSENPTKEMFIVTLTGIHTRVHTATTADPLELFSGEIDLIAELLQKCAPDVVLVNGLYEFPWILSAAAHKLNIPVVIQHGGIWHREVSEYADRFSEAGKELCYRMERTSAEEAGMNIYLNEFSRTAFETLVHPKSQNSTIVPLPHPGWEFSEISNDTTTEKIIGVVGRWDRIKNHEAVLALATRIKEEGLPWTIHAITKIPDTDIQKDFKERYRSLITVHEHKERSAMQDFYTSCDMLIVPSKFDVSPTVVMEAVAAGTPSLISPNVGWTDAYAALGMESWIVDFTDPVIVIERMRELFSLPEWPDVKKFSEHVQLMHNPDKVYSSYLRIFEDLSR